MSYARRVVGNGAPLGLTTIYRIANPGLRPGLSNDAALRLRGGLSAVATKRQNQVRYRNKSMPKPWRQISPQTANFAQPRQRLSDAPADLLPGHRQASAPATSRLRRADSRR